MSLKRFGQFAVVALMALSLGVLTSAAQAGDGNIGQQSDTKGKNAPPAKPSQTGKVDQSQSAKGKGDVTPPESKPSNKGKNAPAVKQFQDSKGKNDVTPAPKSSNKGKNGASNNKPGTNAGNSANVTPTGNGNP